MKAEERAGGPRARRVRGSLERAYPRLALVLDARERRLLANEFLLAHPFYRGGEEVLAELLPRFLAVALEDDPRRGPWLAELARLEGVVDRAEAAASSSDGERVEFVELCAFEHRVDELFDELSARGAWRAPRPAEVLLAIVADFRGVQRVELSQDAWSRLCESPAPALPSFQNGNSNARVPVSGRTDAVHVWESLSADLNLRSKRSR